MQTIKIANTDTLTAPPQGQGEFPGSTPATGQNPPKQAKNDLPGAVSEAEALKTVEGAKITTLTPLSGNDQFTGQQPGASVPLGGLIDGGLAVELMDALLPSILVAVMAAIGAMMKKTDLQLTAREKTTLTPLMQKCMDQLMINFQSPFAAFGVAALIIYGAKITEHGIVQIIDKKAEKSQRDKEQKINTQMNPTATPAAAPKPNEILKPANIVAMNVQKPLQTVNNIPYEPTDEQIFIARKILGMNYAKSVAITRLKNENKKGTLDQFLSRKQKSR